MVVLLLALAPIGHAQATPEWEYYVPIRAPGGLGMHFGDFDGDGRGELVLASDGYEGGGTGVSYRLGVLASTGVNTYAMRSVDAHVGGVKGVTIAWTPSDGVMRVAALVRGGTQTSIVIHAGTSPSTIERVLHAPLVVGLELVADIDGDGSLEMVVRTSTGSWSDQKVAALALESGQIKWVSQYGSDNGNVAAGQLDADPAMELVLAGTPGRILDGASGALEWSYPSGFGPRVIVGRFGDDPTKDAIVAGLFESVILFRSQPYSPVREVRTTRGAFTRAPRTGGGDLLARGSFVYDLRTGDAVAGDHADETSSVAVADLDGDGDLEIAFNDGLLNTSGDRLIVRSLTDNATELMMVQEFGPHTAIATGDIAATGKQEVVFASTGVERSSDHTTVGPKVRVLDAETGALVRERGDLFHAISSTRIALAQLDADPALEIVLSGTDSQSHSLMALDGATLQTQWIATQTPPGDRSIYAMSLVDIDGSGVPAVVVLTAQGRLARYDAATGDLVWYTEPYPALQYGGMAVYRDHAGVPKAITHDRYRSLRVFDLRSREFILSMTFPSDNSIAGVDVFQDADGSCRIGVLREAVVHILACETLAQIDQWPTPAGAVFVRWIRGGSSMLVAAGGVLHLIGSTGSAQPLSGFMGNSLGAGNRAVLREDVQSGEIDLMIGSGHMVKRTRIPRDGIFSGDFDATREGR
ncbi:hypothetical protein ACQQ2N_09495 [Dokdonella sp. MW10]|uniref:hypothetical protein n=1 Tax=Dokdonella sp. MW10 TaxID=2992926 RepID=UPI003F7E47E6